MRGTVPRRLHVARMLAHGICAALAQAVLACKYTIIGHGLGRANAAATIPMTINQILSTHWTPQLLASLFVVAAALWIGTLFSVSWFSGSATMMADGPEIGRLALTLFRRWTVPLLW